MNNVWKPRKQTKGSNIRSEGKRGWDTIYTKRPSLTGVGGRAYDARGEANETFAKGVRQDMMPIFIARRLKNTCYHVAGNKWYSVENGVCRVCKMRILE